MRSIIELKLGKIKRRIDDNYRAEMQLDRPSWSKRSPARCTEVDTGARNIDNILTRTLLPELSTEFLARLAAGEKISSVQRGREAGREFELRAEVRYAGP